jgi:hypothetical protein
MNERLEKEREYILKKISAIRSMRKGYVNNFYVSVKLKNGETAKRGPYYSLTNKGKNGKTISETIPSEKIELIRAEAEKYKLFKQLTGEYIGICEQISIAENDTAGIDTEKAKKNKKFL